jgi:phytoene desaturase
MILAHKGYEVTVFEKNDRVGGRNQAISLEGYTFDTGPTFLMMKFILDEVFEETGRKAEEYLTFLDLDPMYRLVFPEGTLDFSPDHEKTKAEIARLFPGQERGYDRFLAREGVRYRRMYPCLRKDYGHWYAFLRPVFLRFIRWSSPTKSLFGRLGDYYAQDMLRLSFTFQSKYLGMSPWDCPGAFTIIPYVEHAFGIFHTIGGLSAISDAMAKVVEEEGGSLRLETPVKKVMVSGGTARGVELADGTVFEADAVVVNADFGHAMTTLFDKGAVPKYTSASLEKKKLSCSTFMLYLGVDKVYRDLPHHTIVFADDYKANVDDIFHNRRLSEDTSFYIRNATPLDPTLAPEGKSNIYVLVPITNTKAGIDWEAEKGPMRRRVLDAIMAKTPLTDLEDHIEVEHIITPDDCERSYAVYRGATFNLAHNLGQMLYFRPHNRLEGVKRCYIVGGGTHPGSGLPTIYESGRISADLLMRDLGG